MKRLLLLQKWFAIVAAFAVAAPAGNLPLPSPDTTNSINIVDLKRHLNFLASDELGGRYTFSQGNRIAARYFAAQLESYGYRGAARDGSFFQKVPLAHRKVDDLKSALTLHVAAAKKEFKYGEDFLAPKLMDMNVKGE